MILEQYCAAVVAEYEVLVTVESEYAWSYIDHYASQPAKPSLKGKTHRRSRLKSVDKFQGQQLLCVLMFISYMYDAVSEVFRMENDCFVVLSG